MNYRLKYTVVHGTLSNLCKKKCTTHVFVILHKAIAAFSFSACSQIRQQVAKNCSLTVRAPNCVNKMNSSINSTPLESHANKPHQGTSHFIGRSRLTKVDQDLNYFWRLWRWWQFNDNNNNNNNNKNKHVPYFEAWNNHRTNYRATTNFLKLYVYITM